MPGCGPAGVCRRRPAGVTRPGGNPRGRTVVIFGSFCCVFCYGALRVPPWPAGAWCRPSWRGDCLPGRLGRGECCACTWRRMCAGRLCAGSTQPCHHSTPPSVLLSARNSAPAPTISLSAACGHHPPYSFLPALHAHTHTRTNTFPHLMCSTWWSRQLRACFWWRAARWSGWRAALQSMCSSSAAEAGRKLQRAAAAAKAAAQQRRRLAGEQRRQQQVHSRHSRQSRWSRPRELQEQPGQKWASGASWARCALKTQTPRPAKARNGVLHDVHTASVNQRCGTAGFGEGSDACL